MRHPTLLLMLATASCSESQPADIHTQEPTGGGTGAVSGATATGGTSAGAAAGSGAGGTSTGGSTGGVGAGGTADTGGAGSAGTTSQAGGGADAGASASGGVANAGSAGDAGQAGTSGMGAGGMAGSDTGGAAGMPPTGSAICPPGPYEAEPVAAGASATPVCTGLSFAEGAVWFHDRMSLFFSDFGVSSSSDNFNGAIVEYTPEGGCSDFIEDAGTNGLAIGLDGSLVGCRHLDRTITAFDLTTKAETVIAPDFNGDHFSSPNDIAIRSDGNLYFTDPAWQLGDRTRELPQSVYRRDPEGNLSVVEVLDERRPNGVSLSPDETLLYVALFNPNEIRAYDVDATGATSNGRNFIMGQSSDGMVVDCAGNLYLTGGGGVTIYSPEASRLGSISASSASNVAFGGPERKTLFITAGSQLLSIELAIPGLPY